MDIPNDSDSDYDLISNPDPDHEVRDDDPFSVADLSNSVTYSHVPVGPVFEPPPLNGAQETFHTVGLSRTDIQSYVANALNSSTPGGILSDVITAEGRTVRVYVDGLFDGWHIGYVVVKCPPLSSSPKNRHALQLRQAKLSFPSVHLMVGVFSDDVCHTNGAAAPQSSHTERCEVIRHCRWADELVADAPWVVTEDFVTKRKIDYIAVEVGASVDPGYDKLRVYGYDAMKRQGTVKNMISAENLF
jgi:choline-phosphate cytidylyltransferase